MDYLEQLDQGLSSNSQAHQHCAQDLRQGCCGIERKDHSDEARSGGKGLCEGSSEAIEAPQGGVYHCRPFLCEQDFILPKFESQDMFYGNQSAHGQNCSTNIHGIQGDLPVLTPTWLLHYNGTCRSGICTPQGSD
jgi:hypothetical protein